MGSCLAFRRLRVRQAQHEADMEATDNTPLTLSPSKGEPVEG